MMNNSTGSTNLLNDRPPNPAHDDHRAGSGSNGLVAVPDLIYPHLRWDDDDYARLEARLDLYTDFVVLSKFFAGEVSEQYVVDPAEVAAALAGLDLGSGLLPENCLFWSKRDGWDRLGIYLPPRTWLVTVRNEDLAWRIPLPGLVFTGHEYNYSLWAVTDRPADGTTPLYMAPCPNVSLEGVCRGNAPFPRASALTIWQAVEVFFSSKFNRDLSNNKSKAHPTCVLDHWRILNQTGAETYSVEIVDFCHVCDHLKEGCDAAWGESTPRSKAEFERLKILLKEADDGADRVIRVLKYHYGRARGRQRKRLKTQLTYFRNQRPRMAYAQYIRHGWPIASGVMEAACKTLVTQRLKQSGMAWTQAGGQPILTLRNLIQSNRWQPAWELLRADFCKTVTVGDTHTTSPPLVWRERSYGQHSPNMPDHSDYTGLPLVA